MMDEKALDFWKEKLSYFQQQEAIAADPGIKFQLKYLIEECEKQISPPYKQQLYDSLLLLDYEQQCHMYRNFFNKYSHGQIGAFLIHGQSKSCQKWLVHKLIRYVPGINNVPGDTEPKKILVRLNKDESHIEDVWKILANQLRVESDTPKDIVEAVYCCYYSSTVILLFDNLEKLYKKEFVKFINKFWIPLVKKVLKTSKKGRYYLLMFLVDNTGCSSEWNINFLELNNCNLDKQPIIQPIELPRIENFSDTEIQQWVRTNNTLFRQSTKNRGALGFSYEETLAQEFYNETGGIPEDVMKAICEKCKWQWSKIMESIKKYYE